jgi:hypothetical protein
MSLTALDTFKQLGDLGRRADTKTLQALVKSKFAAVYAESSGGVTVLDIASALGVHANVDKRRRSVSLDVDAALTEIMPDIVEGEGEYVSCDELLAGLGLEVEECDEVFVKPDAREDYVGEAIYNEKNLVPRLAYSLEVLLEKGINLKSCRFLKGAVRSKMMRSTPYYCILIPYLNKTILVCDERRNRTFVLDGIVNDLEVLTIGKEALKAMDSVAHFRWQDLELWMELLNIYLEGDGFREMGEAYFRHQSNIDADLEKFAAKLGEGKKVEDLSVNNMRQLRVKCANGEFVGGDEYLRRAGEFLRLATEDQPNKLLVLNTLRGIELEEYPDMDAIYFAKKNKAKVKKDLENFAAKLGEEKGIEDLNTGNMKTEDAECSNGETVMGETYLRRAACALGLAADFRKAGSKTKDALDALKKLVGFEVKVFDKMNKKYFDNVDKIRADLHAYALKHGQGKDIQDLIVRDIFSIKVECSNGEEVSGQSYIRRAGVALGFGANQRESIKRAGDIVDELKRLCREE